MKRLLTLTLFALLTFSCSGGNNGIVTNTKGASMACNVHTQAELDAANERIDKFKQQLLRQGFRESSVSFSDSKEEFVLEGEYGTLKDLRVTLTTAKQLEKEYASLVGGVSADLIDDQADREFEELYNKVVLVVTGDEGPRAR